MDVYWSGDQIQGGRDYQEDYFAVVDGDEVHYRGQCYRLDTGGVESGHLMFVLADGMGGMGHGDLAASLIVENFIKYCLRELREQSTVEQALQSGADAANHKIAEQVESDPTMSGMGATLLVMLWNSDNRSISWLSIGDSLLYLIKSSGEFSKLNESHTWGEQALRLQVETQGLTAEQLQDREHALCSAVDGENIKFVDLQIDAITLEPGDSIILASDGLETLSETQIKYHILQGNIVAADSPHVDELSNCSEQLLNMVETVGDPSQDNTTILTLTSPAIEQPESVLTSTKLRTRRSTNQSSTPDPVNTDNSFRIDKKLKPSASVEKKKTIFPPILSAAIVLSVCYVVSGILGLLPKTWLLW